jgi:hypothetical protein
VFRLAFNFLGLGIGLGIGLGSELATPQKTAQPDLRMVALRATYLLGDALPACWARHARQLPFRLNFRRKTACDWDLANSP